MPDENRNAAISSGLMFRIKLLHMGLTLPDRIGPGVLSMCLALVYFKHIFTIDHYHFLLDVW
jgi:hypothetical protein